MRTVTSLRPRVARVSIRNPSAATSAFAAASENSAAPAEDVAPRATSLPDSSRRTTVAPGITAPDGSSTRTVRSAQAAVATHKKINNLATLTEFPLQVPATASDSVPQRPDKIERGRAAPSPPGWVGSQVGRQLSQRCWLGAEAKKGKVAGWASPLAAGLAEAPASPAAAVPTRPQAGTEARDSSESLRDRCRNGS